jgi:predicted RNA-binding protein with PUA-like domain
MSPAGGRTWLLKSEPGTWSWQRQVEVGRTQWDGVRNHQAKNNLAAMRPGERAFFHHSGAEPAVVGIVVVAAAAHPDTTDSTGQWLAVDVAPVRPLKRPVSLKAIKAEPRLKDMVLVRNSRLSVQPVTAEEWRIVCAMGETDPD